MPRIVIKRTPGRLQASLREFAATYPVRWLLTSSARGGKMLCAPPSAPAPTLTEPGIYGKRWTSR